MISAFYIEHYLYFEGVYSNQGATFQAEGISEPESTVLRFISSPSLFMAEPKALRRLIEIPSRFHVRTLVVSLLYEEVNKHGRRESNGVIQSG